MLKCVNILSGGAICLAAFMLAQSPSNGADAPPASAPRLAFTTAPGGEFLFDTGVLRGKLRPGGKARGLSSVVHVPSGMALDRGDKGYGLFSHYRVFTTGKRYGVGAWDWPSEARLLPDGAAETRWPTATNRAFEMRATYRWSRPDTLDLETTVIAQTNLPRFESFLASYFTEPFTNALALMADMPAGSHTPRLLPADRSFGDWLMFPRDLGVLPLINDGRWTLEPNPVNWAIMPPLYRPLAVRRDPLTGLNVVLMGLHADCFAVAMPYQTDGHYSVYLSLFGRDLKAGETAKAHTRLIVAPGLTEPQIIDLHRTFYAEFRSKP